MEHPGQLDRRARVGQLRVDRRREVLDVRDLDRAPARGRPRPTPSAAGAPARSCLTTISCSSRFFAERAELLAQVVVDRRVGAAARRAGEGDGLSARPAPADEELGACADERRLGRADAEAVARREELAERAEERCGVVRSRRLGAHLAREDDLVKLARPDALDGAGDGLLVRGRLGGALPPAPGRSPSGRASEEACRRERRDGRAAPTSAAAGSRSGLENRRRGQEGALRPRGRPRARAGRAARAAATTSAPSRRRPRRRRSRPSTRARRPRAGPPARRSAGRAGRPRTRARGPRSDPGPARRSRQQTRAPRARTRARAPPRRTSDPRRAARQTTDADRIARARPRRWR